MGQTLQAAGLPTTLFGAEHMAWAFPNAFENYVRNDAVARPYFTAWAVHGYRDGVQADTGAFGGATPTDKPLWMSETSGGTYGAVSGGIRDWGGGMTLARHILGYLRNAKISAWIWYTLMSNSGGGDSSNTYGLMADGAPTDKYYTSCHFYRYIRPGARQVASTSDDGQVSVVAFWHEQNTCLSLVLMNNSGSARTLTAINGSGLPAQFEKITSTSSAKLTKSTVNRTDQIQLAANSITTLVDGTYRSTENVAVAARPTATNRGSTAPRADLSVSAVYTLDGRSVRTPNAAATRRTAANGVYYAIGGDHSSRRMLLAR
jgi:O-glycosyl hydrolase